MHLTSLLIIGLVVSIGFSATTAARAVEPCEPPPLSEACRMPVGMALVQSALCQEKFREDGCEVLLKKSPELKDSFRNCSAQSFCEERPRPSVEGLKGCGAGVGENILELFTWPASLFATVLGERKAFVENCNRSIECKRALAKTLSQMPGSPFSPFKGAKKLDELTDEELRRRDAMFFLNQIQAAEFASKLNQSLGKARGKAESQPSETSDWSAKGLWEAVVASVETQLTKHDCLNAKAKGELYCYGVIMMVDPTKATKLPAGAAKLVKVLSAEKTVGKVAAKTAEKGVAGAASLLKHPQLAAESAKSAASAGEALNIIQRTNAQLREALAKLPMAELTVEVDQIVKKLNQPHGYILGLSHDRPVSGVDDIIADFRALKAAKNTGASMLSEVVVNRGNADRGIANVMGRRDPAAPVTEIDHQLIDMWRDRAWDHAVLQELEKRLSQAP